MMDHVTLEQVHLMSFFGFPLLIIIPLLLICIQHCPLRCVILLKRQHIITSSLLKLSASSMTLHIAGYKVS
jgi:hypothetical protein